MSNCLSHPSLRIMSPDEPSGSFPGSLSQVSKDSSSFLQRVTGLFQPSLPPHSPNFRNLWYDSRAWFRTWKPVCPHRASWGSRKRTRICVQKLFLTSLLCVASKMSLNFWLSVSSSVQWGNTVCPCSFSGHED